MHRATRNFPTRTLIAACATAAALAAPAVASATDRWVDTDTGSNASNNCTVAANPCKTITQASDSSQIAGNFGTIHVDEGNYSENVNIAQGNQLLADDFTGNDGADETRISGAGNAGSAVFVQANASISGFVVASATSASSVIVANSASVTDNTIYQLADNGHAVEILASTGSPSVTGNTIIADNGDEKTGVRVDQNVADATVADNTIGSSSQGFDTGVDVLQNSGADVSGNTIQGLNQRFGSSAKGVHVNGSKNVTISHNVIDSPIAGQTVDGVYIESVPADGKVSLDHNRITGLSGNGAVFADTDGPVSLDGDVIARLGDRGFYAGNVSDLTIENATFVDVDSAEVNTSAVTIDSSILDDAINSSQAECTITYSRGPAIVQGGDGCNEFQTTADPKFVDRIGATPDLRLQPSSPLIDQGNPEAPATGAVDIDGDPRALEGDGVCPHDDRRDIGADEVVAEVEDCPVVTPPPAADTTAPDSGIVGKKKQRGHRARFTLTSTEEGSTFECRLDRGKFAPCDAQFRSRRLNLGRHTLFVRATDAAGNTEAAPTAKKFKLKR